VALRNTCIKNVKLNIIKTRTGCQYVGNFYYSENLNWAACGPRVGHSGSRSWIFCFYTLLHCGYVLMMLHWKSKVDTFCGVLLKCYGAYTRNGVCIGYDLCNMNRI